MKDLMKVLYANTLQDLPPFCRGFWEDDEEFQEMFGLSDDDTKVDYVATAVRKCMELNIRDEFNVVRMLMYCAKGSGDDYEDTTTGLPPPKDDSPKEEELSVVIPTISTPVPPPIAIPKQVLPPPAPDTALLERVKELEKENLVLRRRLNPDEIREKPETIPKGVPVPGRPRGRPPMYPNAKDYRCILCECGLSSSGALFNHYHSKGHADKVKEVLTKSREFIKANPSMKLKIIVSVCNKRNNPNLTTEDPTEDDIQNILDYVEDKVNPISDCLLVEGTERPSAVSTNKVFSWKKVFG